MKLLVLFLSTFSLAAPSKEFLKDLDNFQQKSWDIKVEQSKLEATDKNLLSKSLFWTPDLSLSANQSDTVINTLPYSSSNSVSGTATLNIFKSGKDLNKLSEAQALHKAQLSSLENQEFNTEILASDLIFKTLFLKESLRIQDQIYKLKVESLKIVKDRYAQGRTPLQEITKSEVDLTQQKNKVRLASLAIKENEMKIQWAFVTSLATEDWPFRDNELPYFNEKKQPPTVEQKYWLSQAAESSWRAAQKDHWPTLDFSFTYSQYPLSTFVTQQCTSLFTLKIPLWSKFEISAAESSAYVGFIKADADFKITSKIAETKKNYLVQKLDVARQNLLDAKKNLERSKQLYTDLLRSFRLGRLSTNDLFIEQNRLLESERSMVESQLTYHQTLIDACALQGFRIQKCLK